MPKQDQNVGLHSSWNNVSLVLCIYLSYFLVVSVFGEGSFEVLPKRKTPIFTDRVTGLWMKIRTGNFENTNQDLLNCDITYQFSSFQLHLPGWTPFLLFCVACATIQICLWLTTYLLYLARQWFHISNERLCLALYNRSDLLVIPIVLDQVFSYSWRFFA